MIVSIIIPSTSFLGIAILRPDLLISARRVVYVIQTWQADYQHHCSTDMVYKYLTSPAHMSGSGRVRGTVQGYRACCSGVCNRLLHSEMLPDCHIVMLLLAAPYAVHVFNWRGRVVPCLCVW